MAKMKAKQSMEPERRMIDIDEELEETDDPMVRNADTVNIEVERNEDPGPRRELETIESVAESEIES